MFSPKTLSCKRGLNLHLHLLFFPLFVFLFLQKRSISNKKKIICCWDIVVNNHFKTAALCIHNCCGLFYFAFACLSFRSSSWRLQLTCQKLPCERERYPSRLSSFLLWSYNYSVRERFVSLSYLFVLCVTRIQLSHAWCILFHLAMSQMFFALLGLFLWELSSLHLSRIVHSVLIIDHL